MEICDLLRHFKNVSTVCEVIVFLQTVSEIRFTYREISVFVRVVRLLELEYK